MADQTGEVIQFIWDKYPAMDPEDIGKCVEAIGEWVALEMEKDRS
jgi:hypothetical protein